MNGLKVNRFVVITVVGFQIYRIVGDVCGNNIL